MEITGFHHITLVTRDAAANLAFWKGVLGLRLIKKTVNFDDPASYHLYFGDGEGRPGTAVTFFEWPHTRPGRAGVGGTLHFTLGASPAAVREAGERASVAGLPVAPRPGGLELRDADGVRVRLVEEPGVARASGPDRWAPGLREIAVAARDREASAAFYGELLGLVPEPENGDGQTLPLRVGRAGGSPRIVVHAHGPAPAARHGAGEVHHFALSVPDGAAQLALRERLVAAGLAVSPVMDRVYFRSIYTRDPDGHIVEVATAGPGFTVDEPLTALGSSLRLPPWLEPQRARIEAGLRPIGGAAERGR